MQMRAYTLFIWVVAAISTQLLSSTTASHNEIRVRRRVAELKGTDEVDNQDIPLHDLPLKRVVRQVSWSGWNSWTSSWSNWDTTTRDWWRSWSSWVTSSQTTESFWSTWSSNWNTWSSSNWNTWDSYSYSWNRTYYINELRRSVTGWLAGSICLLVLVIIVGVGVCICLHKAPKEISNSAGRSVPPNQQVPQSSQAPATAFYTNQSGVQFPPQNRYIPPQQATPPAAGTPYSHQPPPPPQQPGQQTDNYDYATYEEIRTTGYEAPSAPQEP